MRAWGLAEPGDYRRLELRAHELLADVPLHDVWAVTLPGGGRKRTIEDVRAVMSAEDLLRLNPIVRALFGLRAVLGRLFAWDPSNRTFGEHSFLHRLTERDRGQSLVKPGSSDGPFTVLYVHPLEAVSEIRNATVHAFSVLALEATAGGYRLFWAIYVEPVSRLTPFYMALIDPFRRRFIYPAILRHVHRSWRATSTACSPP